MDYDDPSKAGQYADDGRMFNPTFLEYEGGKI